MYYIPNFNRLSYYTYLRTCLINLHNEKHVFNPGSGEPPTKRKHHDVCV